MKDSSYRGRAAVSVETSDVRVTVLRGGGHIAEIVDKATGVSPLWIPPWPTIEPSRYDERHSPAYGNGVDARLLAGIMGHNLCLDIFGPPTDAEAEAGLAAHGEGSVADYDLDARGRVISAHARFAIAGLDFRRQIELGDRVVMIRERLENVSGRERAIGWTQHVTLGPPFLDRGTTQFRASATRSRVFESTFGADDYLSAGADFDWPCAPAQDGGHADLQLFTSRERSSAFTTHLMDQNRRAAYFVAFASAFELAFGYVWNPKDFPWMGIWEENHSRLHQPWGGQTLARGIEFGVSPMPETRAEMVARGRLFDVPCFRRLAAGEIVEVEYCAVLRRATTIPAALDWP